MPSSTLSASLLSHIIDVHCHPTDTEPDISTESMASLNIRICAMATRADDQKKVRKLAEQWPDKVLPCFGYHPWFTHWIAVKPITSREQHYRTLLIGDSPDQSLQEAFQRLLPSLPEPTPLSDILANLRENLETFSKAMLGEVGIDRACRIPYNERKDPEETRALSPFTIPLEHQLEVLEAQLDLAVELGRNVSLHSVKSQKATMELLGRMQKRHAQAWDNISIDMHSCGLSPEMWRDIERKYTNVFLSLSTAINSRSPAHRSLIVACSANRILAESDFHRITEVEARTVDMVHIISDVKKWSVETEEWSENNVSEDQWGVVRRLEHNWKLFEAGGHQPHQPRASHRTRHLDRDFVGEASSDE